MFVPFMHVATIENVNMIVTRQNHKINGTFIAVDFNTSLNFLFMSFKKWMKKFLIFSHVSFIDKIGRKREKKREREHDTVQYSNN